MHEQHSGTPVKARVVLVDPASERVTWMNEAATNGLPESERCSWSELPVERVVPMAEALGVLEAVRAVADTGHARHLQTDVVSMSRGSITMVTSLYRIPDGSVLIVTEHAWQQPERPSSSPATARRGRRNR